MVSLALSNRPGVSPEVRQAVLEAAETLMARRQDVTTRAQDDGSLPSGGFKRRVNPELAPSIVIRLKCGAIGSHLPFFTRVSLDRNRPHFVQADYSCPGKGRHVGLDYAPLFSTTNFDSFLLCY
jgi:hypothetical protein